MADLDSQASSSYTLKGISTSYEFKSANHNSSNGLFYAQNPATAKIIRQLPQPEFCYKMLLAQVDQGDMARGCVVGDTAHYMVGGAI